jgi:predicted TIM-barrel fold metal-dependent hydrolase
MDPNWTTESIRPLVFETLDAFGIERTMFASNFPVDKLTSDYRTIWKSFSDVTASLASDERAALFRDNARRFYRVPASIAK